MTKLLIEENSQLNQSGVYIGFIVLDALQSKDRLSIFELYALVRKKVENINYINVMNGLTFLKMLELIDFKAPYISKVVK